MLRVLIWFYVCLLLFFYSFCCSLSWMVWILGCKQIAANSTISVSKLPLFPLFRDWIDENSLDSCNGLCKRASYSASAEWWPSCRHRRQCRWTMRHSSARTGNFLCWRFDVRQRRSFTTRGCGGGWCRQPDLLEFVWGRTLSFDCTGGWFGLGGVQKDCTRNECELILPDGQLLAELCITNAEASVADVTQSTKRRRVAWLYEFSMENHAETVMIVALGGGQRMELFGRVLCHQPWKSGRGNGGSGRRNGRRRRGHIPWYY